MLFKGDVSVIIFVLVVQKSNLENLTFSEVVVYQTLYVFIHAIDCFQALQIVETFKPDCLLIEDNLPMTSGLEFATTLYAQPRMGKVPIILFEVCYTLTRQTKKLFLPDQTISTIPYEEFLLEIIQKIFLFSG